MSCSKIELFFRFTVKGTVLRNNVFFFNIYDGPLYVQAVYSKIRQIWETGFTSESLPLWKILDFKPAILKF
jgi:hypothetical protein